MGTKRGEYSNSVMSEMKMYSVITLYNNDTNNNNINGLTLPVYKTSCGDD